MKAKKLTVIAILAMALVMMIGCGLVSEVESIRLVNPPAASYPVNEKGIDVSNFMVEVKVGGQTMTWPLNDSRLTVEGLVNGRLDTATPGVKTLKITYMGVSITATYIVEGEVATEVWAENTNFAAAESVKVANAEDLLAALKSKTVKTITLTADISLAGKQWPTVNLSERELTIYGENHKINGLTVTNENAFDDKAHCSYAGLFAKVENKADLKIYNLAFNGVVIEITDARLSPDSGTGYAKDFGVVVGNVNAATVSLTNVDVANTTVKGNGRIGGLIGYAIKSTVTIKECNVVATLMAHNPVSVIGEEGDGDKVGGFIGQLNTGNTLEMKENTAKVVVNGTRDCGGFIGHAFSSNKITFEGNTVEKGSIIVLSVEGGMNAKKGARNVGGFIGTWHFDGGTVGDDSFENNVLEENVVIEFNAKYESLSSKGDYIGGYRASQGEQKMPEFVTVEENN